MIVRVLRILFDPRFSEQLQSLGDSASDLTAAEGAYFSGIVQYLSGSVVSFFINLFLLGIFLCSLLISIFISLTLILPRYLPEISQLKIVCVCSFFLFAACWITLIYAALALKRSKRALSIYIRHWSNNGEE